MGRWERIGRRHREAGAAGHKRADTGMDHTSFGRIDSDGTVYVKTATGERVVGSWHAGTIEEGLAY